MLRLVACLAGLLAVAGPALAAPCVAWDAPSFDGKAAWKHVPLSKLKKDTAYAIERDGTASVLRAEADGAASAYVHLSRHDTGGAPILSWRWKADALVEGADNTDAKKEDAPVRLIVGFDGDKAKLPDKEQRRFSVAKKLSRSASPRRSSGSRSGSRGSHPPAIQHSAEIAIIVSACAPSVSAAFETTPYTARSSETAITAPTKVA